MPVATLAMAAWVATGAASRPASAAELKPETIAAFGRYVEAVEALIDARLDGRRPFLWVDALPADRREASRRRLRAGEVVIERLGEEPELRSIEIPSGLVHHWIGTVLLPGVDLARAEALMRDYDRYAEVYAPAVRRAEATSLGNGRFDLTQQLFMKRVVSVVLNAEYDVRFTTLDSNRIHVRTVSTRIAEVEDPDTPEEREKPVGNDRGFVWRLNTYCSLHEESGETLMQCEAVSLSRKIPFVLSWLIKPFVTRVPRESLTFTLEATRRALVDTSAARR